MFVDQELQGQDIDGIELTRKIIELFPMLCVVVVTGWASPERGLEALTSGAYRYISKSVGTQELELLIQMSTQLGNTIQSYSNSYSNKSRFDSYNINPNQFRILAVFANPKDTDPLRLAEEERVIRECIRLSKYREDIQLNILPAATVHDVRRSLLDDYYQIIHFSGHGTGQGFALENERGKAQLVSQDALADFLSAYSPPVECVILNACYSKVEGDLFRFRIPYTIVMNGPISDDSAKEFTRGFYDAIGAGKGIEFAYKEGCRTIRLVGLPHSDIPVLIEKY